MLMSFSETLRSVQLVIDILPTPTTKGQKKNVTDADFATSKYWLGLKPCAALVLLASASFWFLLIYGTLNVRSLSKTLNLLCRRELMYLLMSPN